MPPGPACRSLFDSRAGLAKPRAVCRAAFIKSKMLENEAELMKDVPDWEAGASVYKTRFMSAMDVFGVR